MNYKLAYRIGFHPWEDAESDPPFVEKFVELLDREEAERPRPFGRALDLGTGSGIWAVRLAERGWQVTGVDIVEKALERARERIAEAGVEVEVVREDVTALQEGGIEPGFDLLLDTGTFHGLVPAQREAMGRAVSAVAAPEATLLMLVWPRRRRPLIRGADRADVQAAFPGWTITTVEPSHFRVPKPLQLLLRPDEHWYRLRRG
jgi:cyclopropane fatty-acyl-phospholipid synthase-like methyltransferase